MYFGGTRYPANTGGRVDFETDDVVGQCKNVKSMSLATITALAEDIAHIGKARGKEGVLCVKLRSGKGKKTPTLIIQVMPPPK